MKKIKQLYLRNMIFSILILFGSFFISLAIQSFFDTQTLIPSIFVLSVFLISLVTQGYFYGITSAFISVFAVNFAFTFPFFELNFTIPENTVSAIIMIIITVSTSTLTTKIKRQEMLRIETEKEKMRANLLRAISHDLRTPLTAIYGASSTIIENYDILKDSNKIQMLEGVKEDSQWLIHMVENLLSITKIGNSNVKLIKTSTVLEELIDSVLAKLKKRYPNEIVELIMPDDFITILADAILIEQVLINLLENAILHATGRTKIKLNISLVNSMVVFEVIDDGCGIDNEKLKNIFTGYYISDMDSADSHKQCMGIGLSVCETIIKAHGSTIVAKNVKNGGMCFKFSLEMEEIVDE